MAHAEEHADAATDAWRDQHAARCDARARRLARLGALAAQYGTNEGVPAQAGRDLCELLRLLDLWGCISGHPEHPIMMPDELFVAATIGVLANVESGPSTSRKNKHPADR